MDYSMWKQVLQPINIGCQIIQKHKLELAHYYLIGLIQFSRLLLLVDM